MEESSSGSKTPKETKGGRGRSAPFQRGSPLGKPPALDGKRLWALPRMQPGVSTGQRQAIRRAAGTLPSAGAQRAAQRTTLLPAGGRRLAPGNQHSPKAAWSLSKLWKAAWSRAWISRSEKHLGSARIRKPLCTGSESSIVSCAVTFDTSPT